VYSAKDLWLDPNRKSEGAAVSLGFNIKSSEILKHPAAARKNTTKRHETPWKSTTGHEEPLP